MLVAIGLFLSDSSIERGNFNIAIAASVIFFNLYLQAYYNQQLLASQLPLFCFWLVVVLSMMSVGVSGNTWVWLLGFPAIAALLAGRKAGIAWTLICMGSLWGFAYLQNSGYEFESATQMSESATMTLAFQGSTLRSVSFLECCVK